MKNSQAVISTVGQRKNEPLVAHAATANILNAMMYYEIRRYVLVGGINIDTPYDKKSAQTLAATDWMKANFPADSRRPSESIQCLIGKSTGLDARTRTDD